MKGLHLGFQGNFLEKVTDFSSEYSLLAKGDGAEVIMQTILEGKTFYVHPGDTPEMMEFFYILSGNCICKDSRENLKAGDYFYLHQLEEATYFKAETEMKMLWFITQPVFHYMSKNIQELTKIVKQVEEKDSYTFQHSARVQTCSVQIAKHLQLTKDQLENLYYASLFHDIGKIHVPEEILNKPDRLDPREFELLKKHSYDGAQIVKSTYYDHVSSIILQHHERLDGSGYPYGLIGDEISTEAQIIAIADTYDAMTSDRVYRKGMNPVEAMKEIRELTNRHYREPIVDALEQVLISDGVLPEE